MMLTSREKALLDKRFEDLQRDEQWKAQHCRHCPACGRAVEKLQGIMMRFFFIDLAIGIVPNSIELLVSACLFSLLGCDAMVCGTDAHGGNRQNGCGQSFRWSTAAPYQSSMSN